MILVCHVISQNHVTKGSSNFMGGNHSGHRHCDCGNMIVLVCYLISEDHVTKGSCDFMGKTLKVSHRPRFSGRRDFGRGDITVLACRVIL